MIILTRMLKVMALLFKFALRVIKVVLWMVGYITVVIVIVLPFKILMAMLLVDLGDGVL